jgi:predicted amidohydrolase YtcJ
VSLLPRQGRRQGLRERRAVAGEAHRPEEAPACASRERAFLTFEDDVKGSLEVGKTADVAVLDRDALTVSRSGRAEK